MFEDLYDAISFFWSKKWPTVEAEITAVELERIPTRRSKDRFRLSVAYKFYLGEDGPYTGVSFWEPPRSWPEERVESAEAKVHTGQRRLVRYRPDDASVNALDKSAWEGM